jgi:alpha/beta superfamily hydrolase
VRLARKLATQGVTSIRFDLSGIGDSEARKDSLTFEQSAKLEVREAMDYVQTTKGIDQFILIGLCSGADMGFYVSQDDERVVGLAQLDAFAYRTLGYYVHHYAPRMLRLSVWTNAIKLRLGMKAKGAMQTVEPGADYARPEYRRRFPPKDVVAAGLGTLNARKVSLLFLFSNGQPQHFNHRRQYERSFSSINFGSRIQVEYYPDADHLFSGLQHQQLVDETITSWVTKVARAHPAAAQRPNAATAPRRERSPATVA